MRRFDRIGWQMDGGRLVVEGHAGDLTGAQMTAGTLVVDGDAGSFAACQLAGGRVEIGGNTGDFAAGSLPGDLDGMRGGTLIVRGDAGARFGDRMRRGTALVFGNAGAFAASRMVAGTIGMRGGSANNSPTACGAARLLLGAQAGPPATHVHGRRTWLSRLLVAFGALACSRDRAVFGIERERVAATPRRRPRGGWTRGIADRAILVTR